MLKTGLFYRCLKIEMNFAQGIIGENYQPNLVENHEEFLISFAENEDSIQFFHTERNIARENKHTTF